MEVAQKGCGNSIVVFKEQRGHKEDTEKRDLSYLLLSSPLINLHYNHNQAEMNKLGLQVVLQNQNLSYPPPPSTFLLLLLL